MIRNGIKLSVFLAIYISFSLLFHQGPLINWLDAIVDFSSLSGLLAFLFIESLSVLLWILILTPMFFISIKLGKLIAIILLIINATATFWMSSLGIVINQELIASLFFTDYSEASEFLNAEYLFHMFIFGLIPSALVAFVPIKPITRIRLALYPIGSMTMAPIWEAVYYHGLISEKPLATRRTCATAITRDTTESFLSCQTARPPMRNRVWLYWSSENPHGRPAIAITATNAR